MIGAKTIGNHWNSTMTDLVVFERAALRMAGDVVSSNSLTALVPSCDAKA